MARLPFQPGYSPSILSRALHSSSRHWLACIKYGTYWDGSRWQQPLEEYAYVLDRVLHLDV